MVSLAPVILHNLAGVAIEDHDIYIFYTKNSVYSNNDAKSCCVINYNTIRDEWVQILWEISPIYLKKRLQVLPNNDIVCYDNDSFHSLSISTGKISVILCELSIMLKC